MKMPKPQFGAAPKREEVCFLNLGGLAHSEIVRTAPLSRTGPVSAIQRELKGKVPVYRNTESSVCVPILFT